MKAIACECEIPSRFNGLRAVETHRQMNAAHRAGRSRELFFDVNYTPKIMNVANIKPKQFFVILGLFSLNILLFVALVSKWDFSSFFSF